MPYNDAQLPSRMNNDLNTNLGGGYRWFDALKRQPLFAFGYGLSYTTFSVRNLKISPAIAPVGQDIQVSVEVENTGRRNGDEVVQLYLSSGDSSSGNSRKELKGFKRVNLEAGQTKTVTFNLTPSEFYTYSPNSESYVVLPNTYTVRVGFSSDNLPLTGKFTLTSDAPKPDLQIANIRWVPPYPLEGDSVLFLATIINRGTGPSPSGSIHQVNFSVDGQSVTKSIEFTESIPAGGMALVCANVGVSDAANAWIAKSPGKYFVTATVNPAQTIDETIAANNTRSDTLTVFASPPENLALNKPVSVSSIENVNYPGSNAVDGNLSTRWSSAFSDPQWITIDFGKPISFNKVVLYWETAYGKVYRLQVSNDTANWTTIADQSNGAGNVETYNLKASGRYLRLYGTQRGTIYGYSLYEIQIFNDTSSTALEKGLSSHKKLRFHLSSNYPNPFNPETTIRYELAKDGFVKIVIYNELGQKIRTLTNRYQKAGRYKLIWNGKDTSGNPVASGLYFYRMDSQGFIEIRKMALIR